MNLLTVVLALPLFGFLVAMAVPRSSPQASRVWALAVSLAAFVASLGLPFWFDRGASGEQFTVDVPWIATPDIHFSIAVNGVSLWLIILTTFLTPICVLISWNSIARRVKEFYAFLILLEFALVGVFIAQDLFLFFVFWEVSLVPMYFLIGIWGHDRRIYATVKFFLYTMAGSMLMLTAIIYIYIHTQTFNYSAILERLSSGKLVFAQGEQMLLFLAFFVAFAIKVPLFPLHTWLPDAHVEAPSAGSVMLASVMLKMGTYGLLHYCLPLFPSAARICAPWIAVLAIIGIVYGALVAMVQPNMKKLIAYSSISHLGFVVLGIFSFTQAGLDGAMFIMLAHGISTGGLFMLAGILYERRHTYDISEFGGLATPMPVYSTFFLFVVLASVGLPLLNGFIGEFLVLSGAFQAHAWWGVVAATGVIWSACYLLWMYQRVFFGTVKHEANTSLPDLSVRERVALWPAAIMALGMGVAPMMWLNTIDPAVHNALLPFAQLAAKVVGQ